MSKYECKTEEVRIAHDGKQVYGVRYLPQKEGKCPAVIMSHGFNGVGKDFVLEGELLAENGFFAIACDFCGGSPRSKSSGTTEEMSVETEKKDLFAIIDYVKSLPCVDADHIFLLGASQGGFVSALAAAQRAGEICGIILIYPAFCIPDDWNARFPDKADIPETVALWGVTLGACYFQAVHDLDPFALIGAYQGPVLIIHGENDSVVNVSYARRAEKTYAHAELIVYPGEDHGFTPAKRREAAETALAFVQKHAR